MKTKLLKSIGIGILAGLVTFFICGDPNSATAVAVLVAYMEMRK